MIYLPPPQPNLNKDVRVSGDVEIHPTASLASGVILQAAPNQKISIGADACIGMGAIINAAQGNVDIGSGAILGAGVLIIGASKIGNNCCIGTSSTIFQLDVAPMTVVEPGSILGDGSRQVKQDVEKDKDTDEQPRFTSSNHQNVPPVATKFTQGEQPDPQAVQNSNQAVNSSAAIQVEMSSQNPVNQKKEPVVGQLYINELLITLFPHNKTSPPDPWDS